MLAHRSSPGRRYTIRKCNGYPATARGRPRSAAIDEAVLAAVRRQLSEGGYAALSFAAVARGGGHDAARRSTAAGRPRRRWPSRRWPRIRPGIRRRRRERPSDPFADLVAELEDFRRGVSRPGRLSLVGTMLQSTTAPDAAARYRARVVAPRRARLRAILERAAAEGAIDPRRRPRRRRHHAHGVLVRALPRGRRASPTTGRGASPSSRGARSAAPARRVRAWRASDRRGGSASSEASSAASTSRSARPSSSRTSTTRAASCSGCRRSGAAARSSSTASSGARSCPRSWSPRARCSAWWRRPGR